MFLLRFIGGYVGAMVVLFMFLAFVPGQVWSL